MYKVAVHVPVEHADKMRQVIGEAGGGKIGNYSYASFSVRGIGRVKPESGAHPAVGEMGVFEEVEEERIEFVCNEDCLDRVLTAVRSAHPYEEPAIDVVKLENVAK